MRRYVMGLVALSVLWGIAGCNQHDRKEGRVTNDDQALDHGGGGGDPGSGVGGGDPGRGVGVGGGSSAPSGCFDPNDPAVQYAAESPEACALIDFGCGPDQAMFSNACGCGCIDADP
jgi:hypothetical protein